ncbi:MAG: hypothetical protein KKB70_01745, partial [Proteobacteria bacterium]|nr:hypothetical protein [Pseudomonadota bacterium]
MPRPGEIAPREFLINVPRLVSAYYTEAPDPENPAQAVSFGTSGHRGSSMTGTFNETHILAVAQAIKEKYEREMGKVRNRLPLTLGAVYFGRRTPLAAALDAGRRILRHPARNIQAPVANVTPKDPLADG